MLIGQRICRRGHVSPAIIYVVISLILIGTLAAVFLSFSSDEEKPTITLYCAAGVEKPIAEAIRAYEEKYDCKIEVSYEGSGTLLSKLRVAKKGDLYLAADTSYIDIARERGLLSKTIPLAVQRPVIAVKKGNPKKIKSLDDLLRDDVRVALGNPKAASIGKVTQDVLTKTGHWKKFESKAVAAKLTVNDLITGVDIGSVDAAIVWEANVKQLSDKLELIRVDALDAAKQQVVIGVLKWTENSANALQFARFLQAPEKGQKFFKEYGYEVIPNADEWAEKPKLTLFCGGVNRMAIKETLSEFQEREGIELVTIYNGCGTLVAQMTGGEGARPDVYFACDISFMTTEKIAKLFHPPEILSETDMVIVVPKGNPKNITELKDLEKPGMKVGLADLKKSALGGLTYRLLKPLNLWESIKKNRSASQPTADLLVVSLKAKALDAIIVYEANVSRIKEDVHIIKITEGDPIAEQPIAIGKESKHYHLARRLIDALKTEDSKKRFKEAAFHWRGESR